jgi:hypothetical protein
MTSQPTLSFPALVPKKSVVAAFSGGKLSSDGGVLLLAQLDRQLGLTQTLTDALEDRRDPAKVDHPLLDLIRQRVYQIACGYEDANDAHTLRRDPLFKSAVGRAPERGPDLGSQPTFSRLENGITRREVFRASLALVRFFLQQHREEAVVRVVLDLDATEDPTHGQQELNFYNHHYRSHCYLPLLVYATLTVTAPDGSCQELPEQELLVALLRPVNRDASFRAKSVLARLAPLLRETWPGGEVLIRADSGFARPELYAWCEQEQIGFVFGLAKNAALVRRTEPWLGDARTRYGAQPEPEAGQGRPAVREFGEFLYQAGSWDRERLVTCKAEVMAQGDNPRWLVTGNLPRDLQEPEARYLFYCKRGDRENRIKEWKCDLRADKTSCHRFAANQFRLLLHTVAYLLWQAARTLLVGTELAKGQVNTLRLKLVKVAARVRESHRRIYVQLASSYPWQALWRHCWERLDTG